MLLSHLPIDTKISRTMKDGRSISAGRVAAWLILCHWNLTRGKESPLGSVQKLIHRRLLGVGKTCSYNCQRRKMNGQMSSKWTYYEFSGSDPECSHDSSWMSFVNVLSLRNGEWEEWLKCRERRPEVLGVMEEGYRGGGAFQWSSKGWERVNEKGDLQFVVPMTITLFVPCLPVHATEQMWHNQVM